MYIDACIEAKQEWEGDGITIDLGRLDKAVKATLNQY